MRSFLPVLLFACAGCSEQLLDPGKAVLTSGQEADVWGVDPKPTHARVDREDDSGAVTSYLDQAAPLEKFSLGTGSSTRFVVSGSDDAGKVLVRGRTVQVNPAGLASAVLPVFVSRTDTFARPPGNLVRAQGDDPPNAIVGGRYVLLGGGGGQYLYLDGYDFGAWLPVSPLNPVICPKTPCHATALGVVKDSLALVVGDDWALSVDLDTGAAVEPQKPTGLVSWADVAGGRSFVADDGSVYLVGATRATQPTAAVVHIAADGTLSAYQLITPRLGAAAAWVPARGLVVVGGDATAAGGELLADGAKAFVALPYAPDPTHGAGLAVWDSGSVVRAGGQTASGGYAETVVLSLTCGTSCNPVSQGKTAKLGHAFAFRAGTDADPDGLLVVGTDAKGDTQALLFGAVDQPLPLREPRSGAAAFLTPTGQLALVGGTHADGSDATSLELFTR